MTHDVTFQGFFIKMCTYSSPFDIDAVVRMGVNFNMGGIIVRGWKILYLVNILEIQSTNNDCQNYYVFVKTDV